MQQGDILLQVVLSLLENPLLEINKIEGVGVADVLRLQPADEVGEIVWDLPPVEYPVYHVAAEQPHFYLVPQVQIDFLVLVDALEYMRSCRPVRKLQLIERSLAHCQRVSFLEIFYRHVLDHILD